MARRAVIVGATSAVGEQLAIRYARQGWRLTLVARDPAALAAVAANLRLRFDTPVEELTFDASVPATATHAARRCLADGLPEVTVYVVGANAEGDAACDLSEQLRIHAINFQSAAAFLAPLLPALEQARGASVALIGSVAGDRGRSGNFIYGSAKAALDAYAQGLRARLHRAGVSVTTVRLGYVDSRLSWGLSPPALTTSPERAALGIQRAIARRRDVVYVPGFWWPVMALLRSLPEWLFKRLPIP